MRGPALWSAETASECLCCCKAVTPAAIRGAQVRPLGTALYCGEIAVSLTSKMLETLLDADLSQNIVNASSGYRAWAMGGDGVTISVVCQSSFALTTDLSSLPRICRTGWRRLGPNQCKSIQARLGNVEGLENSVGHFFPDTWYNERFNGTLRKEVLNAEWFHTTRQAQVVINVWLRQYNQIRPHHALNMTTTRPRNLIRET